jgi:hypothetical protein
MFIVHTPVTDEMLGSRVTTASEMLRAFHSSIDGPANAEEARRYRIVQGERICGWSCDPSGPYYEQDKHLCPAECKPGYRLKPGKARYERIADVCHTDPPPLPPPSSPGLRASCSDDATAIANAGVWMLIGVQTGPTHRGRRDGIRRSWKRWDQDDSGVLVCFLIGRVGIAAEVLAELGEEGKAHNDLLWLVNATDAGVPTIKGYHWWRAANRLLPPPGSTRGIRIAAKVDDDSFLHVGNLMADMRRLHCAEYLHYGSIGFTGYDPSIWKLCGWSWQTHGANYRKNQCADHGAYPPFPFMNGVLELLSAPLVRYVATSPDVFAFVTRAERAVEARKAAGWGMSLKGGQRGPRVWRQNEDVALGFWLSRAERRGLFNVTWVRINDRAMNMACISTKGMYQRPRNDTISVHFLKRPGGLEYIWGLLHDGVPHSPQNCSRWVWHDACRSPKDADTEWCQRHPTDKLDPNFDASPRRAEDKH